MNITNNTMSEVTITLRSNFHAQVEMITIPSGCEATIEPNGNIYINYLSKPPQPFDDTKTGY